MSSLRPQILVLPGMGADHRLSEMLVEALRSRSANTSHADTFRSFEFVTPDYVAWLRHESTRQYAERFYSSLVESGLLDPDRLRYVIGISLGGAVGLELPRSSSLQGVLLVGSLVDRRELVWYAAFLARWLAPYLPDWVYRSLTPILPLAQSGISRIPHEVLPLLQSMYRAMPRDFFARSCWALAHWRSGDWRSPHGASGIAVSEAEEVMMHRIHGKDDQVISSKRLLSEARIVKGAKHLVSVSHAPEVASWLLDILTSTEC